MCQNVTMTNYEEIDQYVSNLEEYKVQMLLSFLKKTNLLEWPNFWRTLLHILPGLPLGPKPITSPLKSF